MDTPSTISALSLRLFTRANAENEDVGSWSSMPTHTFGATSQFLFQRAATIYGGAREVQKNIIAKAAFGF